MSVNNNRRTKKRAPRAGRELLDIHEAKKEIQTLLHDMCEGGEKTRSHNEVLDLLESLSDRYFDKKEHKRRTVGNTIKRGIEMAMLMQAYKRCGVADIGAFYYLVGEYDLPLLAKLGTKILPKTIIEANNSNISYATQINIKPCVRKGENHGSNELLSEGRGRIHNGEAGSSI